MKIGLLDVDGHNFPNFALLKIAGYYKQVGGVKYEMVMPFEEYDKVFASKVFTFTEDFNPYEINAKEIIKGGTGYDIKSKLPNEIEKSTVMDYSIYPKYNFSLQRFSDGCIRNCPFCLVREKEGYIKPVEPVELNPRSEYIYVLDNNFFANPKWRSAVKYLQEKKQPVMLSGVDVRIMDEEQAYALNTLKLKSGVHIAWDLPKIDLTERLQAMVKHVKAWKITCYVLVGFNSTLEEDLSRIYTLRRLGIKPFVQPYRDYENKRKPKQYEKDLARWANRSWLLKSMDFEDYSPRKGFKCGSYLK